MTDKLKRDKYIGIRLTAEEHEQLQRRKLRPRLAQWMREHCLAAVVPKVNQVARIDPALLRQLSGIGHNVNQIARAVNAGSWHTLDQVKVIAHLESLGREMRRLKIEAGGDR